MTATQITSAKQAGASFIDVLAQASNNTVQSLNSAGNNFKEQQHGDSESREQGSSNDSRSPVLQGTSETTQAAANTRSKTYMVSVSNKEQSAATDCTKLKTAANRTERSSITQTHSKTIQAGANQNSSSAKSAADQDLSQQIIALQPSATPAGIAGNDSGNEQGTRSKDSIQFESSTVSPETFTSVTQSVTATQTEGSAAVQSTQVSNLSDATAGTLAQIAASRVEGDAAQNSDSIYQASQSGKQTETTQSTSISIAAAGIAGSGSGSEQEALSKGSLQFESSTVSPETFTSVTQSVAATQTESTPSAQATQVRNLSGASADSLVQTAGSGAKGDATQNSDSIYQAGQSGEQTGITQSTSISVATAGIASSGFESEQESFSKGSLQSESSTVSPETFTSVTQSVAATQTEDAAAVQSTQVRNLSGATAESLVQATTSSVEGNATQDSGSIYQASQSGKQTGTTQSTSIFVATAGIADNGFGSEHGTLSMGLLELGSSSVNLATLTSVAQSVAGTETESTPAVQAKQGKDTSGASTDSTVQAATRGAKGNATQDSGSIYQTGQNDKQTWQQAQIETAQSTSISATPAGMAGNGSASEQEALSKGLLELGSLPVNLATLASVTQSVAGTQTEGTGAVQAKQGSNLSGSPVLAATSGAKGNATQDSGSIHQTGQNDKQTSQQAQTETAQLTSVPGRSFDAAATQTVAFTSHITSGTSSDAPHTSSSNSEAPIRAQDQADLLSDQLDGANVAGSAGINTARLIQSMSESEMRLGMHSAEFGDISIRTSVSPQQVQAAISLDHSELGNAISAHIPALQARLGSDLGLHAAIEVNQLGGSYTSGQGQTSQQNQNFSSNRVSAGDVAQAAETESETVPAALLAVDGSRLDIRV